MLWVYYLSFFFSTCSLACGYIVMSGHCHDVLHELFYVAVCHHDIGKHFFSSFPLTSLPFFFLPYRENILKTAKALVEDTKLLVSGAASSQDKLAQAAQSSANTITQLAEVVKLGAASLGSDDPETQVRWFRFFLILLKRPETVFN